MMFRQTFYELSCDSVMSHTELNVHCLTDVYLYESSRNGRPTT